MRRCCSVACSGTNSRNTRLTGLPSGASNGTGCARRTKAPTASFRPLILPCGMASPCPRPVEPRRSRANRLSNTRLLATPWLFSKSSPACSNMRFLLVTSRSRRMFEGGRSLATRFIETLRIVQSVPHARRNRTQRPGEAWNSTLSLGALLSIRRGVVLERIVRMRMQTVFVLDDLAIELVRHGVDRGVQIRVAALDEDLLSGDVTADFHLSSEMVRGEDHVDADDVIKMPPDFGKFALEVTADRRGDRHVTPADDEIHARRAFASKRLSHAHGRYLQRLAVLRDGATRDHDALLAEDLGDLAVRKGFPGILGGNQLLEQRPDSGRRPRTPRLAGALCALAPGHDGQASRRRRHRQHQQPRADGRHPAAGQAAV